MWQCHAETVEVEAGGKGAGITGAGTGGIGEGTPYVQKESGMTQRLPIYAGHSEEIIAYALVDDDDYVHLAAYRWVMPKARPSARLDLSGAPRLGAGGA